MSDTLKIEFKGCSQSFEDDSGMREVVKNITFTAEGTETIAILGPSGCGKSTLLRMVSGMYPRNVAMPTVGHVLINGEEVTGPRDEVLTVFQTPVLSRWMSILGNIMLSFKPLIHGPRVRWPWEFLQDMLAALCDRIPALQGKVPCSAPHKEVEYKAIAILKAVGLSDSMHKFPSQLSGGMKQRAALAATLVVHPKILCMDEPFSALDPTTRIEMRELVKQLRHDYPCLILFVTHDVGEALDLADRILVMSTRPATILSDIRLPVQAARTAAWDTERAQLEVSILQTIREANANSERAGRQHPSQRLMDTKYPRLSRLSSTRWQRWQCFFGVHDLDPIGRSEDVVKKWHGYFLKMGCCRCNHTWMCRIGVSRRR